MIAKTTYQRRLAEVLEAKVPGNPELRHAILRYRVDHTDPEVKGFIDLGAENAAERDALISFEKADNVRPRRGGDGKLTLGMQDRRRKAKKRNYVFVLDGSDNAFYDDVVALAEDLKVVKLAGSADGK